MEKRPQSDHCPLYLNITIEMSHSIEIINELLRGFRNYSHYDTSKRIKKQINIKKLNLNLIRT